MILSFWPYLFFDGTYLLFKYYPHQLCIDLKEHFCMYLCMYFAIFYFFLIFVFNKLYLEHLGRNHMYWTLTQFMYMYKQGLNNLKSNCWHWIYYKVANKFLSVRTQHGYLKRKMDVQLSQVKANITMPPAARTKLVEHDLKVLPVI